VWPVLQISAFQFPWRDLPLRSGIKRLIFVRGPWPFLTKISPLSIAKEATLTSRKLSNTLISIGYYKTIISRVSMYSKVHIRVMFIVVVQRRMQKMSRIIPERRACFAVRKELDETLRVIVVPFARWYLLRVHSLPLCRTFHSSHSMEIRSGLGSI
jgi:hypothetical protein